MFDRFSENAKRTIGHARQAALRQQTGCIDAEHILIGILGLPWSNAQQMLRTLDVDVSSLISALETMLPNGTDTSTTTPFSPAAKQCLELALAEAHRRGDNHIGSQHLLMGVVRGDNDAAKVLARLGVDAVNLQPLMTDPIPKSRRSRTRLLLVSNSTMHGGGYLEHCKAELEQFLGDRKRVMFVPYALHDHDGYTAKARAAFESMGHELESVHELNHTPQALDDADAVFIGGGNTFRLLAALYHYDLLPKIQARAFAGMHYIGSSAGTNVATLSIRTTNDMPIVQPPSFSALQLVPFQINPHYLDPDPGSAHMGETREERINQFHEEHSTPVLGLREGCMLRVDGDKMELRGTTGARLFRRQQQPEEFTPPCDLSFLLED